MKRIVIIDDESVVVEAIRAMVSRAKLDYEIVGTASDGVEGLRIVRELRPDVVVTDIRMPGVDGLSLIERTMEELPMCAFIVISGYREYEYAHRALKLGVLDFIEKPIESQNVVTALMRADEALDMRQKAYRVKSVDAARKQERTEAQNAAIAEVLRYIHANYARDFGLDELSKLVDMSPAYLSDLFKRNTGTSYVKYLTGVRMNNACRMLLRGERASAVAAQVGYRDYNYFCKVFKKHVGLTPSEYRDGGLKNLQT